MLPRKKDERDEKQGEVWLQPLLAEAALDRPAPEDLAYDTKKSCSRAWHGPVAGTDSESVWKSDDNFGGRFSPSSGLVPGVALALSQLGFYLLNQHHGPKNLHFI